MATPSENPTNAAAATQIADKEANFKKQTEYYEKLLQEERQKRAQAEAEVQKRHQAANSEDEEEDSEPYIDRRRLKKEFNQFETRTKQTTQSDIQRAVSEALEKERQQNWLDNNSDFYEVMQHAEALAQKAPNTAKTILNLPDGFERQKLVYNAIKELGINKKEEPKTSIQDEIRNNKKGVYYNPSGVGSAPYQGYVTGGKDYSPAEGQSAYQKMQELKNKLRLG